MASATLDKVATASAPSLDKSPVNPFAARSILPQRLTTVSSGLSNFLSSGFCFTISSIVAFVNMVLEASRLFNLCIIFS